MLKKYSFLLSNLLVILVIIYAFWDVTEIFFQQDEWLGLGNALYRHDSGGFAKAFSDMLDPKNARFLPFTSLTNYLVFNTFEINTYLYGWLTLILTIVSGLLINSIFYKLFRSSVVSSLVAIFWAVHSMSFYAITWIGTLVPSQFSLVLFLVSFYFLVKFSEATESRKWLWFSLVALTGSLLYKEIAIFYLPIYLIFLFFINPIKLNFKKKVLIVAALIVPLLVTFILPKFVSGSDYPAVSKESAGPDNTIYNVFSLPAKGLAQVFIPKQEIYPFIYNVAKVHFPSIDNGFVVESIISDVALMLVSFYMLLIILAAIFFSDKNSSKLILFSFIGFAASFAPFIFFKNEPAILEPRYYSIPVFFGGLLLGSMICTLFKDSPRIKNIAAVLIFGPLIYVHLLGVELYLDNDIKTGQYRRDILNTISEIKPQLKGNNVFFFFTDHTGFYEFQSGFGQTLAVWLYDTGKIPKEALIDTDLWESSYEGLKVYPKGKYGYFMNYEKLLDILKNNRDIALDSVHAYYWDYQKHTVKNVSEDIRKKLAEGLDDAKTP